MKKKLLLITLAIISVIAFAFGLSACGEKSEHVHDWGEWQVTTPATCSAQGEKTRTCKLDSTHTETQEIAIEPTAHDFDGWVVTTLATCISQGEETRTCKLNSNHTETRKTAIDSTAHTYGILNEEQPATCIKTGTIAYYHCSCGKYFNESKEEISEEQLEIAIDSTAHKIKHVEAKAATCTAKGWNAYDICELCGKNDRVETDIDQNAHDYDTDNICKYCKTPLKYCDALTYKIDGQTCTVTGVIEDYFRDRNVVLPHFYNKIPITAIGESAFYNHRSITSVIIPDSVTYIGKMAFADCSSLANINMPDGVTYIGYGAFGGCSKLADINIPDGVNYIGELAFSGCKSLESITIPDGVTSIERLTFNGCEKLQSITIPDSVTSIGEGAFVCCNSLKSIAIPASVTSIGNDVFSNSKYIESITFGDNSKLETIGDRAFNECTRLTNFIIPDGVTSIGDEAFAYCKSLESITIPSSVTSIGYEAFSGCTSLKSVTFENTTGWKVSKDSSMSSSRDITVTDVAQNATLLKTTYKDYYWHRYDD